jgi:hypothetical protein
MTYLSSALTDMYDTTRRASMPEKTTLSFDIQNGLAARLHNEASERGETKESLIDSILTEYLDAIDQKNTQDNQSECRNCPRKSVSIPAVIELKMPLNETQCKPVNIVNISSGGLAIEMQRDSARVMEYLNKKNPFVIIFCIPTVSEIVRIICKPIHITKDAVAVIGSAFLKAPDALNDILETQLGV